VNWDVLLFHQPKAFCLCSEQFYVGGANSIRAFTVRSVGPGGYHPEEGKYSYLDQTGTFRFEANVEYRFRIFIVALP